MHAAATLLMHFGCCWLNGDGLVHDAVAQAQLSINLDCDSSQLHLVLPSDRQSTNAWLLLDQAFKTLRFFSVTLGSSLASLLPNHNLQALPIWFQETARIHQIRWLPERRPRNNIRWSPPWPYQDSCFGSWKSANKKLLKIQHRGSPDKSRSFRVILKRNLTTLSSSTGPGNISFFLGGGSRVSSITAWFWQAVGCSEMSLWHTWKDCKFCNLPINSLFQLESMNNIVVELKASVWMTSLVLYDFMFSVHPQCHNDKQILYIQYIYTYTIFRIFFNLEMPGRTLHPIPSAPHLPWKHSNERVSPGALGGKGKRVWYHRLDCSHPRCPGVPSSWATSNIHCPK